MPEYRIEVETKHLEIYYLDAESEDEARENWYDGEFSHSADVWDAEVVKVEEVED